MSKLRSELENVAERMFNNFYFAVTWVAFLFCFFRFVGWPARNAALVCWVYGSDAYFHGGIRVLPGKPVRFSNGELAPKLQDLVTAFGSFFITGAGLTFLVIFTCWMYEKYFAKRDINQKT